jgi:hypothetical protein
VARGKGNQTRAFLPGVDAGDDDDDDSTSSAPARRFSNTVPHPQDRPGS